MGNNMDKGFSADTVDLTEVCKVLAKSRSALPPGIRRT